MSAQSLPRPSRQFLRARSPADMGRALQELYDNQTRLLDFGVPVGTVLHWLGPENAEELGLTPKGFLLAFGQVVGQADYPVLYRLVGNTYNEVGGTTVPDGSFRLPDLRGYVPQFVTKSTTDNAGVVGEFDDNMDYTTGGASRLLRFFVLPLLRVG